MSKRRYWTTDEDRQLKEWAGKKPAWWIAALLGRPQGGVHHRIRRLGLSGMLAGEHHWSAKVDKLQAEMIWTLREAGYTAPEIKKAFGVELSEGSINDIAACRTWR